MATIFKVHSPWCSVDPVRSDDELAVRKGDIMRAAYKCVADAITAERERCARICDEAAADHHGSNPACAQAEELAAKIREGK